MGKSASKVSGCEKAKVDPEDPIGKEIQLENLCAVIGGKGWMDPYIPDNGEYEWAGRGGSCTYCIHHQPEGPKCRPGCDEITIGQGGLYRRKSYLANPEECCLTGKSMIGNVTCDPKYRDNRSTSCFPLMRDFCLKDDHIFTSEICKTWCSDHKDVCDDVLLRRCSVSDLNSSKECLDLCMKNMGKCDTAMDNFCQKNPGDGKCACLNSAIKKQTTYNPVCVDSDCIRHGYQTSSMLSSRGSGCQIVDCRTYFDIKSQGKVSFEDVNIEQRCKAEFRPISETNTNTVIGRPDNTDSKRIPSKISSSTDSNWFQKYWWIFLIIGIIILGFFFVI